MTGFGSGKATLDEWVCSTEIRSINHRFCDVNFRLPSSFSFLETDLRKKVKEVCQRGKIDCNINLSIQDIEQGTLVLDEEMARNYGALMNSFKDYSGYQVSVKLGDIIKNKDLIRQPQPDPEESGFLKLINDSVQQALEQLQNARYQEGNALIDDIKKRLSICSEILNKIETLSKNLPAQNYQRLCNNLKNLDESLKLDENRIYQEVALFADRSDITEEIVRFRTHIQRMDELLNEEVIGRKADFMMQEINREINTIASKSGNVDISQFAVEIKSELEKIREQIQNIQ